MAKANGKSPALEITPVSAWLEDYETVRLPSGKVVGLRQVDVLSILTADGEIPNILLPVVQGHMKTGGQASMEVDIKDLAPLNHLLERLTRACFVKPAIVDDLDAVKAGDGITVDMVSYQDKIALIAWNMGGQAQIDAATTFLEQQNASLDALQSGGDVSPESEPDAESA